MTDTTQINLPPLPEPIELIWPELHCQALGCGVEDRGIHDRYEAAEYGWQDGADKVMEAVPDDLFTSGQMQEYAIAAIAAVKAEQAAPELSDEEIANLWESSIGHIVSIRAMRSFLNAYEAHKQGSKS
jgi:hypothetical protein